MSLSVIQVELRLGLGRIYMKIRASIISLICLLTFGAFAGMAQTLTSTIQATASGLIGTLATATSPFKGQVFTNATVTITQVANTANRLPCCTSGYYIPNDSASISISGIGTFQITTPSYSFSDPHIDPVKGVTSVEIGFWTGVGGNYPTFPNVDFVYPASTPWNMLSSFGPIQPSVVDISTIWGALTTSGGALQLNQGTSSFSGSFQATFTGAPPAPTLIRSGVLSHIAAGGGWTTVITLVNTSSAAVPVTVALHNDDGSALTLPVTTTQQGASQTTTSSSVSATINPNATLLMSTGQLASTVVGWADVLSTGSLGGYAIFRQTPQTGSPSEGTVPLQSQFPSTVTVPYDNTASFVMGVALANLSASFASVTVTMWDDLGNQLGTQNLNIPGSGHTAFVLPNQFPLTSGKRGIVRFQAAGGITGLGLRFSPFGTFTSVPTM